MINKQIIISISIILIILLTITTYFLLKPIEPQSMISKCNDGFCDSKEQRLGICPEDCDNHVPSLDYDFDVLSLDFDDSPFGFHYASKLEDYSTDLGIKWVRVNAIWGKIQTEENVIAGNFDWQAFESDTKINSYPEDTEFMITLSILGTPISTENSYVLNDGSYKKENWIKFVKAVVNENKDKVKYYQVENEPKPAKNNFAKLQQITYIAIKEECSECQVIMGGFFWGQGSIEEYDKLNLKILEELNGKYVDIYDQHYGGNADEYNPKLLLDHANKRLAENNFGDIPIWISEMSDYSGDPKEDMTGDPIYQSEIIQAQSLFKRYISSLSYGVDKIFWAIGINEGFQLKETYFDFTGLIYDGKYNHDLGFGIKKLSYYTYKIMTEKLEGSDWGNIGIIQESNDIYIYKFTNKKTGKPIWVAWTDNSNLQKVTLNVGNIDLIKITESVPKFESGQKVIDYNTAFNTQKIIVNESKVVIILNKVPIFIEQY